MEYQQIPDTSQTEVYFFIVTCISRCIYLLWPMQMYAVNARVIAKQESLVALL